MASTPRAVLQPLICVRLGACRENPETRGDINADEHAPEGHTARDSFDDGIDPATPGAPGERGKLVRNNVPGDAADDIRNRDDENGEQRRPC